MTHVLLVDDHAVVRAGIRVLLREMAPDIEIIGEANSGESALRLFRVTHYDVVLLDISLPDLNGIEVLGQMARVRPDTKVIAFSTHPASRYGIELIRRGAQSYLQKEELPLHLVPAIRAVSLGGRYMNSALGELLAANVDRTASRLLHDTLSPRE